MTGHLQQPEFERHPAAGPHGQIRPLPLGLSTSPLRYVDDIVVHSTPRRCHAITQTSQSTADEIVQTDPTRTSTCSTSSQTSQFQAPGPREKATITISTQTAKKLNKERNKASQTDSTNAFPRYTTVSTQTESYKTPIIIHSKEELSTEEIFACLAEVTQHEDQHTDKSF